MPVSDNRAVLRTARFDNPITDPAATNPRMRGLSLRFGIEYCDVIFTQYSCQNTAALQYGRLWNRAACRRSPGSTRPRGRPSCGRRGTGPLYDRRERPDHADGRRHGQNDHGGDGRRGVGGVSGEVRDGGATRRSAARSPTRIAEPPRAWRGYFQALPSYGRRRAHQAIRSIKSLQSMSAGRIERAEPRPLSTTRQPGKRTGGDPWARGGQGGVINDET
jgi:hypothetical protein